LTCYYCIYREMCGEDDNEPDCEYFDAGAETLEDSYDNPLILSIFEEEDDN